MFFRVAKQDLVEAITPALCAVSARSTNAAFECLYFQANSAEGRVTVTAFDQAKGVKTSFAATVLEEGGLLLNGHKFFSFVRTLPEGEVSISNDERFLTTISCQKSKFEMPGMSETNFPALPELSGDRTLELPQATLKRLLGGVIFSFLLDDTKPALTGVFFDIADGKLSLCSCDGYRISIASAALKSDLTAQFIVPGKSLTELMKLLHDDEEEPLRIEIAHRHIMFRLSEILFFSRLIDSDYIDYKNSLPTVFSCTTSFPALSALQCVERAALVIDEKLKSPVRMTVSEGTVYLKSETANGKFEEEFAAKTEGEGLTIGFNNRFLSDALRGAQSFGAENVVMEFVSPLKGAVLHPEEGQEFFYMILPIKL